MLTEQTGGIEHQETSFLLPSLILGKTMSRNNVFLLIFKAHLIITVFKKNGIKR
jgi:hypothetical protein